MLHLVDFMLIALYHTWWFTAIVIIVIYSRSTVNDFIKGVFGLRFALSLGISLIWLGLWIGSVYLDDYFHEWLLNGTEHHVGYWVVFVAGYCVFVGGVLQILVGTYVYFQYKGSLLWWILCTGHILGYSIYSKLSQGGII